MSSFSETLGQQSGLSAAFIHKAEGLASVDGGLLLEQVGAYGIFVPYGLVKHPLLFVITGVETQSDVDQPAFATATAGCGCANDRGCGGCLVL
jgi:hypothetical protein